MKILLENSRELYHSAWKWMYFSDKGSYQEKIYDEVNPLQNKQLGTEINVWSAVAVDDSLSQQEVQEYYENNELAQKKSSFNVLKYGIPVAIQSWVLTGRNGIPTKLIGKQMISSPRYERRGIMTALILASGHQYQSVDLDHAYIGCSHFSAPIFEKKFGLTPYSSDTEHDMFKFNVPMDKLTSEEMFKNYVIDRNFNVEVVG